MKNVDRLMKTNEVAEYIQMHKITVHRLFQRKVLPGFKVGGHWRCRKDELDRWMLGNRCEREKVRHEKQS